MAAAAVSEQIINLYKINLKHKNKKQITQWFVLRIERHRPGPKIQRYVRFVEIETHLYKFRSFCSPESVSKRICRDCCFSELFFFVFLVYNTFNILFVLAKPDRECWQSINQSIYIHTYLVFVCTSSMASS